MSNSQLQNILNDFKKLSLDKSIKIQKPFLKWAGGKTKIINTLIDIFPKTINNYHEPFIGGGSVLLGLLTLKKHNIINIKGKIYAYDINNTLINLYKQIKNNKDELYNLVITYKKQYDNIQEFKGTKKPKTIKEALSSKESYYYWTRNKYNTEKDNLKKSSMFLFLNKTCFRGLYREGPNGFNVPFGHYKITPKIINKQEINQISNLFKNVEFKCQDFKLTLNYNFKKNDFIYLDPPYVPIKKQSFVDYTSKGFDLQTHLNLFNLIKKLTINNKNNINFCLSNSKTDIILQQFKQFKIKEIQVRRNINSKNPNSKIFETIITNY